MELLTYRSKMVDLKVNEIPLLGQPNSILSWYPADSEENFKEELKKDPTNYSLNIYKERPIEYRLNSTKHRTPDNF